MPTVLVTGASGMLGSALAKALGKKGFFVLGQVHAHPERFAEGKNIFAVGLDLTSSKSIARIKKEFTHIDVIVHCAAMTNVNECEKNKALCRKINVGATQHMVDLAKYFGSKLIYVSTPMVFSGKKGDYKETSKVDPINYYATSKAMGETIVRKYKQGLVLRFNPIGVRAAGAHPNFVQWFAERGQKNESFEMFSDVVVNPLSVGTCVSYIIRMIEDFKPGVLHFGSRDVVGKKEIGEYVLSKFPDFTAKIKEKPVDETKVGKVAHRPQQMWLNTDKAISLGFKMPSWKTELNNVLKELGI